MEFHCAGIIRVASARYGVSVSNGSGTMSDFVRVVRGGKSRASDDVVDKAVLPSLCCHCWLVILLLYGMISQSLEAFLFFYFYIQLLQFQFSLLQLLNVELLYSQ